METAHGHQFCGVIVAEADDPVLCSTAGVILLDRPLNAGDDTA